MRTTPLIPCLAAALALFAPRAGALNAAATVLPGDTLHGEIVVAHESDEISIYLTSLAAFSVDLVPEAGSTLVPTLQVLDPEGTPLFLEPLSGTGKGGVGVRLVKQPVAEDMGGIYVFQVIAGGESTGKYRFRCTAAMPKKFAGSPTTGQGAYVGFPFDAPAGATMRWVVRSLTTGASISMRNLADPENESEELDGEELTGTRALDKDGTWTLSVNNDGEAPAEISITVTLKLPKASKRDLFLSPEGFGPAPKVLSVTPSKVLDDREAAGIAVTGTGFDPEATIRLERKGQEPLLPTSFSIDSETAATCAFEPQGADPGGWSLVVRNPSGGAGARKFQIQSAGSVKLPRGAVADTEVWWLDFEEDDFPSDLEAMGLGSTNPTTAALAEGAVKSYAIYHLRRAFGLAPATGKVKEGSVPVSFVVEDPPATVGTPGVEYDRLEIGGAALLADPTSNPNYNWGNGPLDAGNASCEDLSRGAGTGLGIRSRVLVPSLATGTAGWNAALKPLLDNPLTGADSIYFGSDFIPATVEQADRYRDVVAAVDAAGRELGGTIAHFVGRSMGTADGVSGIAAVPLKVGEYFALPNFAFTAAETLAMQGAARAGLPGRAKTLNADNFPAREVRAYLLPDATTTNAYSQTCEMVGGRPDRTNGETDFQYAGALPPGFSLSNSGTISGTAPLRDGFGQLVGGAYKFLVKFKDEVSGETYVFGHRINLLVDTSDPSLSPAEVALGTQKNAQTIAVP